MRNRFSIHLALFLPTVFLASSALAQRQQQQGPQKIIAILSTQDLTQIQLVRSHIAERGGRVRAIFDIYGLIADIEPASAADLASLPGVAGVYSDKVDPGIFRDPNASFVAEVWNQFLNGEVRMEPGPDPGVLPSDENPNPAESLSDGERAQAIADYRLEWAQTERSLPRELRTPGCHKNGAGYYDTSLYLAGDVAVGVFYTTGALGPWTSTTIASTLGDITVALDHFVDEQPTANLVFVYQSNGPGVPPPSNALNYVNNLRNIYCTDWAYMTVVQNGGSLWPHAYLHGPSMYLNRGWGWLFNYSVRHETGHIFGAIDQYPPGGGEGPTRLYGYLQAVNANSCRNDGLGYFSGAGECLPDLMNGWPYNDVIGAYTAGQFGWHDNNGDGRLDVRHTFPDVVASSVIHFGPNPIVYSGTAIDRPLLDELPSILYGDVSINWITGVQYRVNGGAAWLDAAPSDGFWDSNSEGFMFTLPPLKSGTYSISIRASNSAGLVESSVYTESLVIGASPVINTRPFATLSVSPLRAMVGTPIVANATGSKDLETPAAGLTYAFSYGGTTMSGIGATASNSFSSAGPKWVEVTVSDGGLSHTVGKYVVIESYDTAPIATFTATPENTHYTTSANYTLTLNANAVRDAETPTADLEVSWDLGTGSFGPWSNFKTASPVLTNLNYPKTDRRKIRMRVRDGALNVSEATRWIWVVPYNHRPTMNPVSFIPVSGGHQLTVSATDPDASTTWDGFLEYRCDYGNDGTFDTELLPTTSFLMPAPHLTARVEVRDRFHARHGVLLMIATPGP